MGDGRAYSTYANPEGTYDVLCRNCDWQVFNVETLETAGHLGDLHVGDEHFDL
jgi:hypothetical protein